MTAEARIVVGVTTFANSPMQLQRLARSFDLACAELPAGVEALMVCTDNSGAPGLEQYVPNALMLDSLGNTGFAASANRLMRQAFENLAARTFVCANPDGAFHHLALRRLIEFSERFPSALVEALQFPEEHPKAYDPVRFDTPWCSGGCLLIPRIVYESVGLFDSGFFMYMEDVDYSWRARLDGFAAKICPRALFAHDLFSREPDRLVERRHLESGRLLAWKWRRDDYVRYFENGLLARGWARSAADLPALPAESERMPAAAASRVAAFDRRFAFAPCRW
jgi:N-acetylglucosaminyl-diphospho-decaprenol L-rhamnosyltransferase